MKVAALVCLILLALTALASMPALAQTVPHFQHIVLIIQENRTPDNLFGAGSSHPICGHEDAFETGVDIQDGGYPEGGLTPLCLTSTNLQVCWDIDHSHEAWNTQADIDPRQSSSSHGRSVHEFGGCGNTPPPNCPQYTFVQKSDVQPYFDIATNYGFANYMFATNQGPSFPAHQFLISGTSAPTPPGDASGYYLDFVADNGGGFEGNGCEYQNSINYPEWVDFTGFKLNPQPPVGPCYDHPTLIDLLDNHVSWRYYSPEPGAYWTAVDAIQHLCHTPNTPQGYSCNTPDWVVNNMSFESNGNGAPILTDILTCQLQQVSWVVPDERWSDHASLMDIGAGPSYVADIVDAIGNNPSNCVDRINGVNYGYWQDTAIFIVWDDWGGFYDHVAPQVFRAGDGRGDCESPGLWGCGNVRGFRVPLLVVSAYTPAGYVSGACTNNCPQNVAPYVHDFGSMLRFTELNFGLPQIAPVGHLDEYADINAPDAQNGHVPLSDFFQAPYRSFTNISPAAGEDASYFIHYFTNNSGQNPPPTPVGPDGVDED